MQIVIDIPEETYNDIQSRDWKNGELIFSEEWKAIHNGIPLPKGHGRLVDEKEILNTDKHWGWCYDLVDMPAYIADIPTIIEADEEVKEQNG